MSLRTNTLNTALVLSATALLGACGGGGGGGDNTATISSTPVTISSANAPQVSGAAYDATAGLEGAGTGGTGILTGAVTQTSGQGVDLVEAIVSQVKATRPLFADSQGGAVTGAQISESANCSNGGSFSFTLNDNDNDLELSSGDTISMNFNSCNEAGFVMNGGLSVNNVAITGDTFSAPYSMQMTLQANNFSASENGETVSLNGGMTLNESTSDGLSFSSSLSGNSIQVNEAGVTVAISNFQIDATEDNSTGAYTLDINATVSSSEIGGSVTIVTDTVFQGVGFDNPSSGQATFTGADNSSVTLIALDSVNVRLEIDEDGDGAVDVITDTTWDAL